MDEAHERALNTDVLMGLIKKVVSSFCVLSSLFVESQLY